MAKHRSDNVLRIALLCIFLLTAAGLGMSTLSSTGHERVAHGYSPAPAVPRLAFLGDAVAGAVYIRDFDAVEDEIYLLDSGGSRVIVMHEDSGHWRIARTFGQRGGGPGELMQPTGIAVNGGRVLVADRDRIHSFDRAGRYLGTRALLLPCNVFDVHVYGAGKGLLVAGRCMRADTATAELFFVAADSSVQNIAHDPIFTSDGGLGSIFAASTFYSPDDDHGLFGGGTGPCVYRITGVSRGAPRADSICGLGDVRYPFMANAEFRAKAKAAAAARPFAAAMFAIPELLPVYADRLPARNGDVILQPFTNDSLVFRDVHTRRDIMVGGVEGLVGCRAAGCLWITQDSVPLMMFVPTAVIDGATVRR